MSKPYLNYEQQIKKLKIEKGLIVDDESYAKRMMENIGYFALIGGYKTPFINPMTRKYEGNTTFEDIIALYRFDEKLRNITFEYIIKIEQKIRQVLSNSFCANFGEDQSFYLDKSNYNCINKNSADVIKLISILSYHANINKDQSYLVHQRNVYHNVPLWVTAKVLTFGQLSKMYLLLQHREQSDISKSYNNVSERELSVYLKVLTLFRNVCAHNERLYSYRLKQKDFPDKPLHKKMNLPMKGNKYLKGKNDYFGLIIAFRYLLLKEDFTEFKKDLKRLIESYTTKSKRLGKAELLEIMGMPENWEKITRYRL